MKSERQRPRQIRLSVALSVATFVGVARCMQMAMPCATTHTTTKPLEEPRQSRQYHISNFSHFSRVDDMILCSGLLRTGSLRECPSNFSIFMTQRLNTIPIAMAVRAIPPAFQAVTPMVAGRTCAPTTLYLGSANLKGSDLVDQVEDHLESA